MRRMIFAALAGAIFGLGLLVSGMTDTTRVHGWLDVFGDWDPTLAFVMGGALIPMAITLGLGWRGFHGGSIWNKLMKPHCQPTTAVNGIAGISRS